MNSRKEIKDEVKYLFKGNWKSACSIAIIPIIITLFSINSSITNTMDISNIDKYSVSNTSTSTAGEWILLLFVLVISGLIGGVIGLVISSIYNLFVQSTSFSYLTWIREMKAPLNLKKSIFFAWGKDYRKGVFDLTILSTLYIVLWSILLIIPGIIKTFSYSQVFFIYKDQIENSKEKDLANPKLNECLTISRQLMMGHKFEYFVLSLSFIGWYLLAGLTFGIGFIWLIPYTQATYANYYNKLIENS